MIKTQGSILVKAVSFKNHQQPLNAFLSAQLQGASVTVESFSLDKLDSQATQTVSLAPFISLVDTSGKFYVETFKLKNQ